MANLPCDGLYRVFFGRRLLEPLGAVTVCGCSGSADRASARTPSISPAGSHGTARRRASQRYFLAHGHRRLAGFPRHAFCLRTGPAAQRFVRHVPGPGADIGSVLAPAVGPGFCNPPFAGHGAGLLLLRRLLYCVVADASRHQHQKCLSRFARLRLVGSSCIAHLPASCPNINCDARATGNVHHCVTLNPWHAESERRRQILPVTSAIKSIGQNTPVRIELSGVIYRAIAIFLAFRHGRLIFD